MLLLVHPYASAAKILFLLTWAMFVGSWNTWATAKTSSGLRFVKNGKGTLSINCMLLDAVLENCRGLVVFRAQRWADCKIFQSESSPDLMKLNPMQSWSAKFLKIISPIQSWSTNVKSCIFILPHEAKALLELFCHHPNTIGWRQNSSSSAFASWGKRATAFLPFPKFNKEVSTGHQREEHC